MSKRKFQEDIDLLAGRDVSQLVLQEESISVAVTKVSAADLLQHGNSLALMLLDKAAIRQAAIVSAAVNKLRAIDAAATTLRQHQSYLTDDRLNSFNSTGVVESPNPKVVDKRATWSSIDTKHD